VQEVIMLIRNIRPVGHKSFFGLVDVYVPELGLTLYGVELHEMDGERWTRSSSHHAVSLDHPRVNESGQPLYTTDYELDALGFPEEIWEAAALKGRAFSEAIWAAALLEGAGS
jgi:hypothetical protein